MYLAAILIFGGHYGLCFCFSFYQFFFTQSLLNCFILNCYQLFRTLLLWYNLFHFLIVTFCITVTVVSFVFHFLNLYYLLKFCIRHTVSQLTSMLPPHLLITTLLKSLLSRHIERFWVTSSKFSPHFMSNEGSKYPILLTLC